MSGLFNIQKVYADMLQPTVENPFTKYSNMGIDPLTAMIMGNMDKNMARVGLLNADQRYNKAVAQLDPKAADYNEQMLNIAQKYRPGHTPALRTAMDEAAQEQEDRERRMRFEDTREERAQNAERRAEANHEWQTREHQRLLTEYEEGRASRATVAAHTKSYLINNDIASLEDLEGLSDQGIIDLRTALSNMESDKYVNWQRNLERERAANREMDRRGLEQTISELPPLPEGAMQDGSLAALRSFLDNTGNEAAFSAYIAGLKSFEDAKAREATELAKAAATAAKPSAQLVNDTMDSSLEYFVQSGGFDYVNHRWILSDKTIKYTNMADLLADAEENGELNGRLSHITAQLRSDITMALRGGLSPQQAAQWAAEKAAGIPLGGIGDSVTVPNRDNTPDNPPSQSQNPLNADQLLDKDLRDAWLERKSRNGLSSFLGAAMFDAVGGPQGFSVPNVPTRTAQNIQNSADRAQRVQDNRAAALAARQQERERARLAGEEERRRQAAYAILQNNTRR